jgi:hypothetical protein
MKENPKFIGRQYTDEEIITAEKTLKKWSDNALHLAEEETEKTTEEMKLIREASVLIGIELESLGITNHTYLQPNKIHLLSDKAYKNVFPNEQAPAFHSQREDAIFINKEKNETKTKLLYILIHELIHRASTQKFYAKEPEKISNARLGYQLFSKWKNIKRSGRLRGFNEIITDYTAYSIISKYSPIIQTELNISPEEIKGITYGYYTGTKHYGEILETIVNKIAEEKKVSVWDIYDNFKRGLFENTILKLKDVENTFGTGSLEVLSLLQVFNERKDNDPLTEMIYNFFTEEDTSKRPAIKKEIEQYIESVWKKEYGV